MPAPAVYSSYIMVRTQIFLDEAHEQALRTRARSEKKTKSALIREAIDQYLDPQGSENARVERLHEAVREAAGVAPYLPDGAQYVDELRRLDAARFEMLEARNDDSA